MTTKFILKVHNELAKNLRPDIAGKLRNCDVFIGGHKKHFVSEALLMDELKTWVKDCNFTRAFKNKSKEELEMAVREWHVAFERIHPFQDFNGRTGRILMNVHRMRFRLPLLIIHEGKEQANYYHWFSQKK